MRHAPTPLANLHVVVPKAAGRVQEDKLLSADERVALDNEAAEDEHKADDSKTVQTAPEHLPIRALESRLVNLGRKLAARQKRLAKEQQTVCDKDGEIASLQVERVQLRAVADATSDEIKGIHEARAELFQRLAKLNAVQEQQETAPEVDTQATADCLSKPP